MTGKSKSNNNIYKIDYGTIDSAGNGTTYTYTYGTGTHTDSTTNNWYIDDSTHATVQPWDWTTPASTGWNETVIGGAELIWLPQKCTCCEKDIKVKIDSLSIRMGKTTFWFHRRCFSDKKNARFIRSLIISEDLELLD